MTDGLRPGFLPGFFLGLPLRVVPARAGGAAARSGTASTADDSSGAAGVTRAFRDDFWLDTSVAVTSSLSFCRPSDELMRSARSVLPLPGLALIASRMTLDFSLNAF